MKFFENAEDRDQTLMFFSVTAIICAIIWIFKEALFESIEHILMLFIGAFTTLLNFHHKRKNGQHENGYPPPVETDKGGMSKSEIDKAIERIRNG